MDIKICGLSTVESADAIVAGGATHAGFIFFEKSPRHVTPETAGILARKVQQHRVLSVAVTVDAGDDYLDHIVETMRPDLLQLHGSEPPGRVMELKQEYGLPVMKALSICDKEDLDKIELYQGAADRLLFDAKPPKGSDLPGGNGVSFDWSLLSSVDPTIDYMLSGGLDNTNVGSAIKATNPPGIDISSGVESGPGIKDLKKIGALFDAVDNAIRELDI